MRQVINRKVYDTEKALLIGVHEQVKKSPFCGTKECLYRTKRGEFFLTYEGKFLDPDDNQPEEYASIFPVSDQRAEKWAFSLLGIHLITK